MKLFGTSLLALIACGVTATSVSSGELTAADDQPIVMASLIIVESDNAYPLSLGGVARSVRIGDEQSSDGESGAADMSALAVPSIDTLPDPRLDQIAALNDQAAFFQHRVIGELSAVPVPTPRPEDMSIDGPGDRPMSLKSRPVVRQAAQPAPRVQQRAVVRVATNADTPRKRSLRANPIFIGMYR